MGILDNLLTRLGYTKPSKAAGNDYPPFLRQTADIEKWEMPDPSIYANQMSLRYKSSWIDGAIKAVAQQCAMPKFNVKRVEGERLVDIPNHPFERLLNRPNDLESRSELMNLTATAYKLNGNAYWWLNIVNGTIYEIWPLEPHRIQPIPDGNQYLAGYMYYPGDGQELPIPAEQIVHFKQPTGRNRFIGIGDIESIALAATNDIEMIKWNAKLFGESNAKLPGILAFKEMVSNTNWTQIQDDIRQAAKSQQYLMLRGVGESLQWLQNTYSQKDMEFLASRTFTEQEIYKTIAPGLASMLAVNATEANARAGKETFMELAVYPVLSAIAEKITNQILPMYEGELIGEFDDVRVVDRQMRMREEETFAKTHTINEIRAEFYQDDPLPDERGNLLPSQITAQSFAVPDVMPKTPEQQPPALQARQDREAENQDDPEEADDQKAAEWGRLENKAIKAFKAGKLDKLKFESDIIDQTEIDGVIGTIETAESVDQIKKAITQARDWKDYP